MAEKDESRSLIKSISYEKSKFQINLSSQHWLYLVYDSISTWSQHHKYVIHIEKKTMYTINQHAFSGMHLTCVPRSDGDHVHVVFNSQNGGSKMVDGTVPPIIKMVDIALHSAVRNCFSI